MIVYMKDYIVNIFDLCVNYIRSNRILNPSCSFNIPNAANVLIYLFYRMKDYIYILTLIFAQFC